MSVTSPLLKELKVHLQPLIRQDKITDTCLDLWPFCEVLERIFLQGRVFKDQCLPHPWAWLKAAACEMERGTIHRVFAYVRSYEVANECSKTLTDVGRFRLLVRSALVHKCLNVPVEVMVRLIGDRRYGWYQPQSILGNDVLGEILLSVLLHLNHLSFDLDLTNSRFLDISWDLVPSPMTTFVPCETLGLVVTFINDLAVIVAVDKASVAAEDNKIEPGDILDELNNQVVNADSRGKLKGILKNCKHQPITVRILKTNFCNPDKTFAPILRLYQQSPNLRELSRVRGSPKVKEKSEVEYHGGYNVQYMGFSAMGRRGDVSQVERGIRKVVDDNPEPHLVTIFCRELEVVVYENSEDILRYPYMNIASCGHSAEFPKYFAFMVGNGECSSATEYNCHVFVAKTRDVCASVLISLGNGFQRTQCAA